MKSKKKNFLFPTFYAIRLYYFKQTIDELRFSQLTYSFKPMLCNGKREQQKMN